MTNLNNINHKGLVIDAVDYSMAPLANTIEIRPAR
jgi:hypothetical protein